MKLFVTLALALFLTAALQSRADEATSTAPTIGTAQVAANIGKQVTVTGRVAQVTFRPTIVFLNFDKPYPKSTFTAVIGSSYTNQFENLSGLRGKAVAVTGRITDYNGRPEMRLTGKSQLKLLSETK